MNTQRKQTEENQSGVWQRPDPVRQQVEAMISEGGGVIEPKVPWHNPNTTAESEEQASGVTIVHKATEQLGGKLRDGAHRFAERTVEKLADKRGEVGHRLGAIPARMHRVANQSALLLELIEDYRRGRYRDIPEFSMAVVAGAVLYAINPADLIPETVPLIGAVDDMLVLALALRVVREDLKDYCRFKGYQVHQYFPSIA